MANPERHPHNIDPEAELGALYNLAETAGQGTDHTL
jgi:hypothetical protein